MNIRRVLAVTAIPFVIGMSSLMTPNQANAEPPLNQMASQQHPRPQDRPQRPEEKQHDRRQKSRPHHKKPSPQPPRPPVDR